MLAEQGPEDTPAERGGGECERRPGAPTLVLGTMGGDVRLECLGGDVVVEVVSCGGDGDALAQVVNLAANGAEFRQNGFVNAGTVGHVSAHGESFLLLAGHLPGREGAPLPYDHAAMPEPAMDVPLDVL
jgi:hypothetical protein